MLCCRDVDLFGHGVCLVPLSWKIDCPAPKNKKSLHWLSQCCYIRLI